MSLDFNLFKNRKILHFLLVIVCLVFCSPADANASESLEKGILYFPISSETAWLAEPGKVVIIKKRSSDNRTVDIEIDGEMFQNVEAYSLIPFDPIFSVSKAYLTIISQNDAPFSFEKKEDLRYRYLFAKNIFEAFPKHFLSEEIHYLICKLSEEFQVQCEGYDGKGLLTNTISFIQDHLKRFPKGKYFDELEWRLVVLQNHVYEYEGCVDDPIDQAKIFTEFLKLRPNSKVKEEILLHIAYLYRVISECDSKEFNNKEYGNLLIYKEKAINLLKKVLASNDLPSREKARVALFNIANNRTCYSSKNGQEHDW